MTTSVSSRRFATDTKQYGLRIGHVNVYHLYDKVQDVCMLLTKSPYIHLLGLSETRLNSGVGMNHCLFPAIRCFGATVHVVARLVWDSMSTTA